MEDISNIFTEDNATAQEAAFYDKPFKFSYSSLNKLLYSPVAFYTMYVLGLKEEKIESYLVQGKIIHGMILEEHRFDQDFIISPAKLPTDNIRVVIDRIHRHHTELLQHLPDMSDQVTLNDYENAIIDILFDMNYHQALKTDKQRIEKIITPESESYFQFLLSKGNRTLIDQQTYDFCKGAVDIIKAMPSVQHLLGLDVTELDNVDVFNELYLEADLNQYPFGIKGFIDNIKVDHTEKIIYVNDLKTSGKELKDFEESIEFYYYWLQAVIYLTLVSNRFRPLLENGYELKFHFIVIDKFFNCYPFPVSEKTLAKWHSRTLEALNIADYHYTNRRYQLPYAFDKALVTL